MASIIRQAAVGDGYDVLILTGGQSHVLHFLSQPSSDELTDRIGQFESGLRDQAATQHQLESEETDEL